MFLSEDSDKKKRKRKSRGSPIFFAEPMRASNSFVGTEEYIAPVCIYSLNGFIVQSLVCNFHYKILVYMLQEIITGAGHTSAVDWWALGSYCFHSFFFWEKLGSQCCAKQNKTKRLYVQ